MAALKRFLRILFDRAERLFDAAFGPRLNPLAWLGAFGWYFFWIVAGTGIYLYIFFDTGITNAYASVEYITNDQWYAAGIMRSLHRYGSDALVVVIVLHLLREFSLDRLRGRRFFAWLTGVPALFFIYICGITGYWLVWDRLAQYIAIATAEWLDTLPFFAEPIANNFLNATTLGDRFFTLMVFIHIFAPLFMLLLMWVHIQRHARGRVNPPRPLAIGTGIVLVGLSLVHPAVSQGPANLDIVPAEVGFDWFYLPAYALLDIMPGGQLWLVIFGGLLLLALMPWLPPKKPEPAAVVSLENCNGCARCFADCPFSAITMAPRSDGKGYDTEAVVNVDNCMSCGLCVGSCPTATPFRRASGIIPGIELPDHRIADLREQTIAATDTFVKGRRVLVYACEHSNAQGLEDDSTRVVTMPCVAMLPPSFIDFALSRNLADGVAIAGCADGDCYYRLGDDWMRQRIDRERDPFLRDRVDRARLRYWRLRSSDKRGRLTAREEFAAALQTMPKNHPSGRSNRE
ncbi:MAG: hydrogenase iron-sulfur subunit [Gammaproteobacteria bacterium]|nr:hydrogenase iron-sulfur subunit [Gammaproteobacteria bacterium]